MQRLILVVDDEPKIVKQAQDYLENSGFRVVAAGDATTALAAARRERPDLIVLDLNLPGMDGLEICPTSSTDSGAAIDHAPGPRGQVAALAWQSPGNL